jgi:TonB family protein
MRYMNSAASEEVTCKSYSKGSAMKKRIFTILAMTLFVAGCAANVKQASNSKQTWPQRDIGAYNTGIKDYDSGKLDAAVGELTTAANDGYPPAQYKLGVIYTDGTGVNTDAKIGMDWLQKAAAHGNLDADLFLAKTYRFGMYGIKKDMDISQAYFEKVSQIQTYTWKSYEHAIYSVIDAHKTYPRAALKAKITGTAVIEFKLRVNEPFDVRLRKSSGNDALDNTALTAVKDSVFPKPPNSENTLDFSIPIIFTLD